MAKLNVARLEEQLKKSKAHRAKEGDKGTPAEQRKTRKHTKRAGRKFATTKATIARREKPAKAAS